MNGYIAFYRGKEIEVYAETQLDAKIKAVDIIKAALKPRGTKWVYDVHIGLCETHCVPDGKGGFLSGRQVISRAVD